MMTDVAHTLRRGSPAIDERQRELSNWVFDIWHFPGEEAPAEHAEAPAGEASAQDAAAELEQLREVPA